MRTLSAITLGVGILAMAAPSSGDNPPLSGLESRWTGNGTAQDAVGPNHGTTQGGVGYADATMGQGFDLNGVDGHVVIQPGTPLYPSGSFTIDAFVNTTDTDGTVIMRWECGEFCPSGIANSFWGIDIVAGRASAGVRTSDAESQVLTSTNAVNDGSFHQITFVRDVGAGLLRLYIDGALDISVPLTADGPLGDNDGSPDPATIGAVRNAGAPGVSHFLDGVVDDVKYYDRALTPNEIQSLNQKAAVPSLTFAGFAALALALGLVGWSRLRKIA